MEELEKNKDRVMTGKVRGRGYTFSDGSFEFYPESGEKGTLYEPVGRPLKNGNLQKSIKIYKLQVSAAVNAEDPAAEILNTAYQLVKPLEKKATPQALKRAVVAGRTAHAVVYSDKDKIQVVFTISRQEQDPDLAYIDPKVASEKGISLTIDPQKVIAKEVMEVCSIINSNSQNLRTKSTPKKTSVR